MAAPSEPRFLVLHGLRVKHYAPAADLASAVGLDADATEAVLRGLEAEGLVRWRGGAVVSGWSLTPAGRDEQARLVDEELQTAGAKAVVEDAYRGFLALNPELLQVCTDWQLRGGDASVPNDHSDAEYDRRVVARLAAVDEAVQPITTDLAGALDRFGRYGPRLAGALDRVRSGDGEWIAKPLVDSYHTVWMELHEDLLSTLGIQRGEDT